MTQSCRSLWDIWNPTVPSGLPEMPSTWQRQGAGEQDDILYSYQNIQRFVSLGYWQPGTVGYGAINHHHYLSQTAHPSQLLQHPGHAHPTQPISSSTHLIPWMNAIILEGEGLKQRLLAFQQGVPAGGLVVAGAVQRGTFPTAPVPVDSPAVPSERCAVKFGSKTSLDFSACHGYSAKRLQVPVVLAQNPPLPSYFQILPVLRRQWVWSCCSLAPAQGVSIAWTSLGFIKALLGCGAALGSGGLPRRWSHTNELFTDKCPRKGSAPPSLQGQQRGREGQLWKFYPCLPTQENIIHAPWWRLADDKRVLVQGGSRSASHGWCYHPFPSCARSLPPLHHLGKENERHTWAHKTPSHPQGAPDTTEFVTCVLDAAHLSTIKV